MKKLKNNWATGVLLLMVIGMGFALHSFTYAEPIPTQTVIQTPVFIEMEFTPENTFLYDKIAVPNKKAFVYAVKGAAERIGVTYNDLIFLFYMECGMTTIRATAKNTVYPFKNGTYAYGLNQMTPKALASLGVTYEELLAMNAFEQLNLFVRYVEWWGKPVDNFADLYLLNYLPSYLWRSNNTSIARYQSSNPQLGATLGEFRQIVNSKYRTFRKQYGLTS